MSEAPQQDQLPFDNRKQLAVLGHLLKDSKFFEQAHHKIKPEWFNNPIYQKIYKIQLDLYQKHKIVPTIYEVSSSTAIICELPQEQTSLRAVIASANLETDNFSLGPIKDELTKWMHCRLYVEGLVKSQQLYNQKRIDEAFKIVDQKINAIKTTKFDDEEIVSFDRPDLWLAESEVGMEHALTTGLKIFDDSLHPAGNSHGRGGLFRGDTTILLAGTNSGKTTGLITMAIHNIDRGKDVLFFTHEGRKYDIREKMLCAMTGRTKPQLFQMYKDPVGLREINLKAEMIKKHLDYVPYNKPGMVVEDVIPMIQRLNDRRKTQTGRGYDLLVSDYPAKLSTMLAKTGNLGYRHIIDIVYEQYVQLALDLDLHALLAIQANRQGSIANQREDRFLGMEDVAEAWGPMTSATNVFSINRDYQDSVKNRVSYFIAKSRSSTTGKAIVCNSNYAACLTHSELMGGISYQGGESMGDKIEKLLQKYKGQEVDQYLKEIEDD